VAFFYTQISGPSSISLQRRLLAVATAFALFVALPLADAAQCMGTTRTGERCKRQVSSGSYCYQHNPAVKHYSGTTKSGYTCRDLPETGGAYCKMRKQ